MLRQVTRNNWNVNCLQKYIKGWVLNSKRNISFLIKNLANIIPSLKWEMKYRPYDYLIYNPSLPFIKDVVITPLACGWLKSYERRQLSSVTMVIWSSYSPCGMTVVHEKSQQRTCNRMLKNKNKTKNEHSFFLPHDTLFFLKGIYEELLGQLSSHGKVQLLIL